MIIPNQSNLKVHFAGVENIPHFACVNAAGVNYSLFTVFPFILPKIKSNSKATYTHIPELINTNSKHTIMDSGLFSLMFGSYKGKKDKKFIEQWMNLILEFINVTGYKGTFVEVDCQKVLGVNEAWQFRQYMKTQVNNRMISVFHLEDGQKGLDRMIDFSDYIAISLPELRLSGKKEHTYRLANYIKNKKPSIDIHLLGCTENKLLKQCNFCSTSDSTSWLTPVRYGVIDVVDQKLRSKHVKEDYLLDLYKPKIEFIQDKYKLNLTKKGLLNTAMLIYQAEQLKVKYASFAGNQD